MTLADSIRIEYQLDPDRFDALGIRQWPVWSHDPAVFPWAYDEQETCYLLQGEVVVTLGDGSHVQFGAGDLVVFPNGLSCTWDIRSRVSKHYRFD